ncbi:MAG: DUF4253 domain-containing protein, partial [Saprospiraceae bacterium]
PLLDAICDYKQREIAASTPDTLGHQYAGLDIEGITFAVGQSKANEAIATLSKSLNPYGYCVYFSQLPPKSYSPYVITILDTADDMDILRFQYTCAINYGLGPDDIISKVSAWRVRYPLDIAGAGFDWVMFRLHTIPEDLDVFIDELITFCPDYLQQDFYSDKGPEHSKEMIKMYITYHKIVRLWWD